VALKGNEKEICTDFGRDEELVCDFAQVEDQGYFSEVAPKTPIFDPKTESRGQKDKRKRVLTVLTRGKSGKICGGRVE